MKKAMHVRIAGSESSLEFYFGYMEKVRLNEMVCESELKDLDQVVVCVTRACSARVIELRDTHIKCLDYENR